MSLYQLWYAIAQHYFAGVTCTEVLELFAMQATTWTVLSGFLIPYLMIRRSNK